MTHVDRRTVTRATVIVQARITDVTDWIYHHAPERVEGIWPGTIVVHWTLNPEGTAWNPALVRLHRVPGADGASGLTFEYADYKLWPAELKALVQQTAAGITLPATDGNVPA